MSEPRTDAYGWQSDRIDLDAYLARIGVTGDLPPTEDTLRTLTRGHALAIPFENLEIALGRPVPLGLEDIQAKLVRSARGGYCYEHVLLFAAVLERLGFTAFGMAARVGMGTGVLRPATHALLRVRLPGSARDWLCDVGFGYGLLEPLEIVDGAATRDAWPFRLERGPAEWLLYGGEVNLHSFTLDRRYTVDYTVCNHYVSGHPRSPFTGRLAALAVRPSVRYELDDTTLTTARLGGATEKVRLEPGEVPKTLEEAFGIELTAEDTAGLVAFLARKTG